MLNEKSAVYKISCDYIFSLKLFEIFKRIIIEKDIRIHYTCTISFFSFPLLEDLLC